MCFVSEEFSSYYPISVSKLIENALFFHLETISCNASFKVLRKFGDLDCTSKNCEWSDSELKIDIWTQYTLDLMCQLFLTLDCCIFLFIHKVPLFGFKFGVLSRNSYLFYNIDYKNSISTAFCHVPHFSCYIIPPEAILYQLKRWPMSVPWGNRI